jgi:hypothetical protein
MYRYILKHPATKLNQQSGAFSTIPSERASSSERSRPSPQASGTAIVGKTERQPEVAGLPPLPPPERTEGARGRGGVLNSINTSQLTKKVLKTYSAKCVISGDHAETYEYRKAQTGAKPGKHGGSREPKKREARMDNIFRAKRTVRRLINANVDRHSREKNRDKFLTLTFAENMTDIQQANRHFHNFMKKLRYHHGAFEYVGVPQIQWQRYKKYGVKVWHYHVAVFGLPYVAQKELVEEWGRGTVSIEAMEAYENPGSYMSRYMGKDFAGEELTGHRRFFTSRGLYRPEETRAESVGAILARLNIPDECKTFEVTYISNPLVGPVTYRHYDLRKRPPIRNHGAGGGRDDAEAYDTLIAVPYTDKEQSYLEI